MSRKSGACGLSLLVFCLAAEHVYAFEQLQPSGVEVRCHLVGDAQARVYVLSQMETDRGKLWHLAWTNEETQPRWIRVELRDAEPAITPETVELSYQSSNGGVAVDLMVTEQATSLDVYVSYELEVNVDVELKPEIDLLNTDGVLTNVRCQISGQ